MYGQWLSVNQLAKPPTTRYALLLEPEDAILLKKWRSSGNKRSWERAVALEGLHKGSTLRSICQKLERSPKTNVVPGTFGIVWWAQSGLLELINKAKKKGVLQNAFESAGPFA